MGKKAERKNAAPYNLTRKAELNRKRDTVAFIDPQQGPTAKNLTWKTSASGRKKAVPSGRPYFYFYCPALPGSCRHACFSV